MNVLEILNRQLLEQSFASTTDPGRLLTRYQQVAQAYASIENAVAVLSDLGSNKSYVYYGGIADRIGLRENSRTPEINSIWEEDIFHKIHEEDVLRKHALELRFLHFIKEQPAPCRSSYYTTIPLRIKDDNSDFMTIQHRMFYVLDTEQIRLALCLYSFLGGNPDRVGRDGAIVNSSTGELINTDAADHDRILSDREKQILKMISTGKRSREIAHMLHISINTVSRHRQNILEKLCVRNSVEAYKVAELMRLV